MSRPFTWPLPFQIFQQKFCSLFTSVPFALHSRPILLDLIVLVYDDYKLLPNVVAEWLVFSFVFRRPRFQISVWRCAILGYLWFYSVSSGKFWDNNLNRPRHFLLFPFQMITDPVIRLHSLSYCRAKVSRYAMQAST